ncbi:MAG: hypothetical protein ACYSR6_00985, partial [Planctomycetota bacterium]
MAGPKFRVFDYSWAYSYAAGVREELFAPTEEGWLGYKEDWLLNIDDGFKARALNPTKFTFLHVVIDMYVNSD